MHMFVCALAGHSVASTSLFLSQKEIVCECNLTDLVIIIVTSVHSFIINFHCSHSIATKSQNPTQRGESQDPTITKQKGVTLQQNWCSHQQIQESKDLGCSFLKICIYVLLVTLPSTALC